MASLKKLIIGMLFFPVYTFAQKSPVKQTPSELPAVKLKTSQDSLQYALGAFVADYLGRAGFTTVDVPYFLKGMDDILRNHPRLIADSLIYPFIANSRYNNEKQKSRQLETELFNFLKEKTDLGKLPDGVQYRIINKGKGPRPAETDSVVIHYKGTLPDGTVFENTYLKNAAVTVTPATIIPGLGEVLQLMQPGATWQVFIPSALGYGPQGTRNIPPGSALMITVELLEIRGRK